MNSFKDKLHRDVVAKEVALRAKFRKDLMSETKKHTEEQKARLKKEFDEKLKKIVDKVYPLPPAELELQIGPGPLSQHKLTEPIFVELSHIDTVISLVKGKDANLMVVDPRYYEDNEDLLKEIAKDIGHKIIRIAKSEAHLLPANMVHLPDGRTLINKAPRLKAQLEKHGVKVIMMDRAIKNHPKYLQGGIRCMTLDLAPRK